MDDEHLGVAAALRAQHAFQRLRVVVREGLGGRAAEAAALLDGVVGQPSYTIRSFLPQKLPTSVTLVECPPTSTRQSSACFQSRQFAFQLLMQLLLARQQAAAAGAGAVLVDGGLGGLHHLGAAAHACVL
jgi:hypothetical protein